MFHCHFTFDGDSCNCRLKDIEGVWMMQSGFRPDVGSLREPIIDTCSQFHLFSQSSIIPSIPFCKCHSEEFSIYDDAILHPVMIDNYPLYRLSIGIR